MSAAKIRNFSTESRAGSIGQSEGFKHQTADSYIRRSYDQKLMDIDDAALRAAHESGGISTIVDTVAAGLRELALVVARRREIARLESGDLAKLRDPAAREAAWR